MVHAKEWISLRMPRTDSIQLMYARSHFIHTLSHPHRCTYWYPIRFALVHTSATLSEWDSFMQPAGKRDGGKSSIRIWPLHETRCTGRQKYDCWQRLPRHTVGRTRSTLTNDLDLTPGQSNALNWIVATTSEDHECSGFGRNEVQVNDLIRKPVLTTSGNF